MTATISGYVYPIDRKEPVRVFIGCVTGVLTCLESRALIEEPSLIGSPVLVVLGSERLETRVPVDWCVVLLVPSSLGLSLDNLVTTDTKLYPSLTEWYRFSVPVLLVVAPVDPIFVVGVLPERQDSVNIAMVEVENGIISWKLR